MLLVLHLHPTDSESKWQWKGEISCCHIISAICCLESGASNAESTEVSCHEGFRQETSRMGLTLWSLRDWRNSRSAISTVLPSYMTGEVFRAGKGDDGAVRRSSGLTIEDRSVRGPVDGRSWLCWVIDNVVWNNSWQSIAGAGCGLICVGAGEEWARKVYALRGLRGVERQVGLTRGTRWPAGSSEGHMVARKGRRSVTPVFPKKTKCNPICMPGSSFMHIVDISE
jgi:hypothetical protein